MTHPTARSLRRRMAVVTAALAVSAAAAVGLASPAMAAGGCYSGQFCAFDGANYSGMLLASSAGRGSNRVDVADDRVSSMSNRTGNQWEGITVRRGLPDQTVYRVAPYTDISWVGSNANDRIDHFNVR